MTLELGGKSPAIVGPHARFDNAVDNLVAGKTMNAGQTCVAPDYVLVPRGKRAGVHRTGAGADDGDVPRFRAQPGLHVDHFRASLRAPAAPRRRSAKRPARNSIRSPTARLTRLHARFPLIAVTSAPDEIALMQEEIFGPLLPIVPYDTLDDAIAWINARPRPLALYLYDDDAATIRRVEQETIAGGMAVNETLMHLACESLPFGGVGASGMGAYHGYEGFVTFSKMKPVLTQARWNTRGLIAPPYGKRVRALLKLMLRF